MLPGYVAGYYTREQCHVDLMRLCSQTKTRFIKAEVIQLDTINKLIYTHDGRPPISYDITSIDIGITPKLPFFNNQQHDSITPVKPIDGFSRRWDTILQRVLTMDNDNNYTTIRIAIVGGGAGGVELCFAVRYRLITELNKLGKTNIANKLKVCIINRGDALLSSHNSRVQNIIQRLMKERNIEILLNTEIIGLDSPDSNSSGLYLLTSDGRRIEYDEAIWCTSATAQSWCRESGLQVTSDGFICVKNTLESSNIDNVFACGDVAHLVDNPRPKAGVFAVSIHIIDSYTCQVFNILNTVSR
jgi:selenide,water dikinase